MRVKPVLVFVVVVGLCACSSTSKAGRHATRSNPAHPTVTLHVDPSSVTKMICEAEAKKEIAASGVGFDTIQPLKPVWDRTSRVYSCDYVYAGGATMTLSVTESSSAAESVAYFDSLAQRLGKTRSVLGTGEGAYATTAGDMVVRKDDKVLLVDVSKLPSRFGRPVNTRNDVAAAVAVVIMGCWGGKGLLR